MLKLLDYFLIISFRVSEAVAEVLDEINGLKDFDG